MTVVAVLLPSAALFITYLFVLEAIKYRAGILPISRRRFRLRLAAWLLTLGLCAGVFVGLFAMSRHYMLHHPFVPLALWTTCLIAAVALIVIMYADVKEVEEGIRRRESELWRDFARALAEKEKRRQGGRGDQDKPKA